MSADNITLKLDHWKQCRSELEHRVLLRAAQLPTERLQQWVLAFNLACGQNLEAFFFSDEEFVVKLRKAVPTITVDDLMNIYGSLYLALIGLHRSGFEPDHWQAAMAAAHSFYSHPKSGIERWIEFINANERDPAFPVRLTYRVNDEIAPIFQLLPNDPIALMWLPIIRDISDRTRRFCDNPNWAEACRGDIANAVQGEQGSRSQPSGCALELFIAFGLFVTTGLSSALLWNCR
jgi:hypothetical protein